LCVGGYRRGIEFSSVGEPMNCQCHRAFSVPEVPHWRPMRDREPGAEVRIVAFAEDDPAVMRMVRVAGGWHGRGVAAPHPDRTGPEPWAQVGLCWAGREHPVVDVTVWSMSACPSGTVALATTLPTLAAAAASGMAGSAAASHGPFAVATAVTEESSGDGA